MRGMNKEDGEMFWYLMVFTALCGGAVLVRFLTSLRTGSK